MTDIVERLRDKHCCDDACHCDEAAAEIKRLRAALENIRELNFTSDGWAHSDLIEQEIVFALTAQPAAPGGDND